MATPEQIRPWIRQAEADLAAAGDGNGTCACHRRYWLQQSYEKAIKAYAMIRWGGRAVDDGQFRRLFLLQHGPLTKLSPPPEDLSKALHLLMRDAQAFIRRLPDAATILKLDATAPSTDPAAVSYRYPFEGLGETVAPADFAEWDTYQGNETQVRKAVTSLLQAVRNELATSSRTPK